MTVPDSFNRHVFVAEGGAEISNGKCESSDQTKKNKLQEGDAVRLTEENTITLTADSKSGAEVLIWQLGK